MVVVVRIASLIKNVHMALYAQLCEKNMTSLD